MAEGTGCEERGAVGAAERGGSGEEGAGEKGGAGGIPSMEKGSALQERSRERRQGKEDRGSAGETEPRRSPHQWAAGGGVARLTQMELAGGPWSPAVTVTEPCVSSPWSDWPWSLRIRGLEGGQLAGKPGHGVLEGSVGLRRASGKGGAAVRERKRWG